MPVVKECIGDKLVTVLRDTECSGAVIRKELVTEEQLTRTSQRCKLADGRIIGADVAVIKVDFNFNGSVNALYFDSPSYDLFLGNIRGVKKPNEPNSAWIHLIETRGQLKNAPATFSRLMRKLLQGIENVENFIDDVIIFTDTFEEHRLALTVVFKRLRAARLIARPTKCFNGFDRIDSL